MSISITTVNFGDFPMARIHSPRQCFLSAATLDDLFLRESIPQFQGRLPGNGNHPLLFPASILFSDPMPRMHMPLDMQIPTPVCTSDFPDELPFVKKPRSNSTRTRPKRRRTTTCDCCICLDPMTSISSVAWPCKHELHRLCLFSLMNYPVLGERSMVHCPLCRDSLDRYDIRERIGCDVSVKRMAQTALRCDRLRKLTNGSCASTAMGSSQPLSRVVAQLVQGCRSMTADDGFVYNVAILAIDRAILHRKNFARSLEMQLRSPRSQDLDTMEFIQSNLACHIQVLIRTSMVSDDG